MANGSATGREEMKASHVLTLVIAARRLKQHWHRRGTIVSSGFRKELTLAIRAAHRYMAARSRQ